MSKSRKPSFRTVHGAFLVLVLSLTLGAAMQPAATPPVDPGLRGGPNGAGGPLPGLSVRESRFFETGRIAFQEIHSVTGSVPDTEEGLGPRFNLDSCAGCHAQPAVGGTSPDPNPQFVRQSIMAPGNVLPSFITEHGPVREARFKSDGGVHDLFVITGRPDAAGCNISQPVFPPDTVFRVPTPVFGAGLIEAIKDYTIMANKAANGSAKQALGISGQENREGNTGTITRFGWKAQNKSLEIFSGEAYNVEQGVSNALFPQERDETPGCVFNTTPEDHTNYELPQVLDVSSDAVNFATFMLFLAPPTPVTSYTSSKVGPVDGASIERGFTLFTSNTVGCYLCHTPSLPTGKIYSSAVSDKTANLFSDLLLHDMGNGLADDIRQGSATGREFRTAPLWGLGQRIFFLHDGRTDDLLEAIQEHSSAGSEATGSVKAFNGLSPTQKQDLLNFLRSL